MLDEIKKIMQSLKKGVVVVENGKPSYVVVPFDEFERIAEEPRRLPQLQPIDDASLIRKMIEAAPLSMEYGADGADAESGADAEEGEIQAVLNALDREKEGREAKRARESEAAIREVNLEDLPF